MILFINLVFKTWKHYWQNRQLALTEKHKTKIFFKTVDRAIEMCKREPRKYYIMQKSLVDYEILSSVEIKKLKKFKVVKKDENFVDLDEKSFIVKPENLDRLIHESKRRKLLNRWKNLFFENYYNPITEGELQTLKYAKVYLRNSIPSTQHTLEIANCIEKIIEKHS